MLTADSGGVWSAMPYHERLLRQHGLELRLEVGRMFKTARVIVGVVVLREVFRNCDLSRACSLFIFRIPHKSASKRPALT